MQEICVILGFISENAQKFIKKGSDYHKLCQLLEVVYIAPADELMQLQRSFMNLDVLEEVGVFQSTNVLAITFMIKFT